MKARGDYSAPSPSPSLMHHHHHRLPLPIDTVQSILNQGGTYKDRARGLSSTVNEGERNLDRRIFQVQQKVSDDTSLLHHQLEEHDRTLSMVKSEIEGCKREIQDKHYNLVRVQHDRERESEWKVSVENHVLELRGLIEGLRDQNMALQLKLDDGTSTAHRRNATSTKLNAVSSSSKAVWRSESSSTVLSDNDTNEPDSNIRTDKAGGTRDEVHENKEKYVSVTPYAVASGSNGSKISLQSSGSLIGDLLEASESLSSLLKLLVRSPSR
jgi:hypothetical protein